MGVPVPSTLLFILLFISGLAAIPDQKSCFQVPIVMKTKHCTKFPGVKLTTSIIDHVRPHRIRRPTRSVQHSRHVVHLWGIGWTGAHHALTHVGITGHPETREVLKRLSRSGVSSIRSDGGTYRLCMELVAGCGMGVGSWGFLLITGGGHIPEPTCGGMLPWL